MFFKVGGRKQVEWKGEYAARPTSGTSGIPVPKVKELRFFSIGTQEWDKTMEMKNTKWFVYPISWLSTCTKFVVYPPDDYKVSGKYPHDWKSPVFHRHYIPQDDWEEFEVFAILNLNKPGNRESRNPFTHFVF